MTADWTDISAADERDALHSVSQMMVGTKILRDEPGVVFSLAAQQAHPADAQAIDAFMQSLDAEKQVTLARASGDKIMLSGTQQSMLRQNGVNFDDVQWTQQDTAKAVEQRVQDASSGNKTVAVNKDGSLKLDPAGQIRVVDTHHDDASSGWFDSVGSFFGHLGGAVGGGLKAAGEGAWTGLQKGYNFAQSVVTEGLSNGGIPWAPDIARHEAAHAEEMRAQGYDPDSMWSGLAFAASGKSHTDLTPLIGQYGHDKVDEALTYLSDPEKFRASIEANPDSYITGADGRTALTPAATAKLQYLASDKFATLAKQVNAHSQTIGNEIANDIGIDPVAHSTTYALTAAGANIAASFVIDPSLMLLQGVKVAKFAAVGIDTLGDSDRAASILASESKLPWIKNVQRGWQSGIDYGKAMRATTDITEQAALTAEFSAKVPGLAPIGSEFIGSHALTGWEETVEAGKRTLRPVLGDTGGIHTLDDAAEWVKSKQGLNLLQGGRASTQASLMPGGLSAFGYRTMKGAVASWMTTRSAIRAERGVADVVSRATADPLLAEKLITEGMLRRIPPTADDAVAYTGDVLAERAPVEGLASADRSGKLAVTAAGRGDIAFNIRKTGDALGESPRWGSAAAIAARGRLAAQRFTTLLPRNTLFDVTDPQSGDKIYKYALTYLNRGDANTLRALWNSGNGGQRKAIISGLVDQLGHAAGLGRSAAGQKILDGAKTAEESYSAAGSEIELAGQRLGLFEGQTRQRWLLPSFQSLQQASAKVGLWEATFGRAATKSQTDALMSQWKMGALFKPSTTTRNMLEGWLRTALDGKAGAAVKARVLLTTRNKELWDRGYGVVARDTYQSARGETESLDRLLKGGGLTRERRTEVFAKRAEAQRVMESVKDTPIVQHLLATESGDVELAQQIERGSVLSGDVLGRSTLGTKLADSAPLALVGRAYRLLVGRHMDDADIEAFLTMAPDDVREAIEGYGQQALAGDLGFKHAANEATLAAKAGWGPAKIRYAVDRAQSRASGVEKGTEVHWTHQALDGTEGVDRYANALAQRVNGMPATARAALAYIEDPKLGLQSVVDALDSEKRLTAFGKVFFENPITDPHTARRAVNAAEETVGKRDWAQKVVDEYAYLLTGQNTVYQKELADYITEHGVAPDGNWIADHIVGDARPETALAPQVMAMVPGGVKSLPQALQDIEGGAYQWLVERPLQRLTTSPVFMANYTIARRGLNKNVEELIQQGFTPEAADNFARELATKNAWVKSEQLIDDPGQKTQFDVIARNMFPFSRAAQAMIRRWGTGLWQNPAAARKLMLSYEGAVHSGLIYDNAYGEKVFTYPGSGALGLAMRGISQIPGFDGIAQFPISSDMTGAVLMSVPGAENPLRISMGPMLAVPLREIYKHWLPTAWRGDAEKLDAFINGPIGVGETSLSSWALPTVGRNFYRALSSDDRNSALASSTNGAFANLAAAGLIPPPDASPAVLQEFRARLQTQVRSQLFLRAVFGLFAPAAPSTPTEGTSGSGADYAWSVDGLRQMSDEYRAVLNETGGDIGRATAVFTALHPDDVVYKTGLTAPAASAYETARTESTTHGAYLPATTEALRWMESHDDFITKFGSVAAYFLPHATTGEPFNDAAYQSQLEFGLRIKKTPPEFMDDVYVKHAETGFYPGVQGFDDRIAAAKAAGDTAGAASWTAQKSEWEKEYKALNPALGAKLDDFGPARATALGQLADLRLMLKDGDVPDKLGPQLQQLLAAYDGYVAFVGQHPGGTDVNTAARSNALGMFNAWAQQQLSGTPLASVFNGVFRTINSNLSTLAE